MMHPACMICLHTMSCQYIDGQPDCMKYIFFLGSIFAKGRGQEKKHFLGQSPQQRIPPTHPVSLELSRKLSRFLQNHELFRIKDP